MMYPNLTFPKSPRRPYFYTNFVTTVDGKVQVLKSMKNTKAYWPIGSALDYKTLIELRTHADVLIHGKKTALSHSTVSSLGKEEFKKERRRLGKKENLLYVVMSNHPDKKLFKHLYNPFDVPTKVVTGDIPKLVSFLQENKYKHILVEGGPLVLASFLEHGLIDEVFLTIAPKIFGNKNNQTLTMVEGVLLEPKKIKTLQLISAKPINSELYLRYKVVH